MNNIAFCRQRFHSSVMCLNNVSASAKTVGLSMGGSQYSNMYSNSNLNKVVNNKLYLLDIQL